MACQPVAQCIQYWPIDKLVFYARNPRKNDSAVDRMCSSIREVGLKVPSWPAVTARSWTAICASRPRASWTSPKCR
jgi:hypothetical protein